VVGVLLIDKVLDDPVGALSAHGLAGIWGTLACGLFTDPALATLNGVGEGGFVYTGSLHQLFAQFVAVSASFATVFALSFATFFAIKATIGLLPALAALIAMIIFVKYPLNDERFKQIRDETEARKLALLTDHDEKPEDFIVPTHAV